MLPVDMLETTTQIMITNPLAPVNGAGASSVLLASKVTPSYSYQDGNKRTLVNFPGGGGIAADASGISPLED